MGSFSIARSIVWTVQWQASDSTFQMRAYHQVAQRDMWRIFNIKVINLFTWREGRTTASCWGIRGYILACTKNDQVILRLRRWRRSAAQPEEKLHWLIRQEDSDSAQSLLISGAIFDRTTYCRQHSTPLTMEFGERKRRRKSQSFKLVTDGGKAAERMQDLARCAPVSGCLSGAVCQLRRLCKQKRWPRQYPQSLPRFPAAVAAAAAVSAAAPLRGSKSEHAEIHPRCAS